MNSYSTTIRDLCGNASIEAIELADVRGFYGLPDDVQAEMDAAFGYGMPDDELTEREIDALYEAEMERRDLERQAAEVFGGAGGDGDDDGPEPPDAGAMEIPDFSEMPDDELIAVVGDPNLRPYGPEAGLLAAATDELLRRIDATQLRRAA